MDEPIQLADEPSPPKSSRNKPDFATFTGVLLGIGGIVGGLLAEGGKLKDILQATAALIVLGGTAGAVLISTPLSTVAGALRRVRGVVFDAVPPLAAGVEEMVGYAIKARKNGLVSLEREVEEIQDPFLRMGLNLGV